jgi:bisanhydrobacterioruberin hydratase
VMTSESMSRATHWERNRFRFTLGILIVVYAVGTVGILSAHSERFIPLTFANLMLTALLLLANAEGFGRRAALAFLLCMVAGFCAEVVGVKTGVIFGVYHYTDRMGPRLIDVPLVIGLNWAILLHAVQAWLGRWLRSRTLMASAGATLMTAFDWVMEPVAIRLRFWAWDGDTVPLRNYLAWWGLSFVLLLASDCISPRPRNRLAPWVLGVMLVFFAIIGFRPS